MTIDDVCGCLLTGGGSLIPLADSGVSLIANSVIGFQPSVLNRVADFSLWEPISIDNSTPLDTMSVVQAGDSPIVCMGNLYG
jgi:hypothetical protein